MTSHAATDSQTTSTHPARFQATAPSAFRRLPIFCFVRRAIFPPTALDSSGDFFVRRSCDVSSSKV